MIRSAAALFIFALVITPVEQLVVHSQEVSRQESDIRIIGQFGGAAGPIALIETTIFVASGANIVKLKQSNDGSWIYEQSISIVNDVVTGMVAISPNVICVTAGREGLYVIDIPDDGEPQILSHLVFDGTAEEIVAQGEVVFVAAGKYIHVIDIHDAARATEIKTMDIFHTTRFDDNMALHNGILAIATQIAGLIVFDVQNPQEPQMLAFVEEIDAAAVSVWNERVCVFVRHTPRFPGDDMPTWYLRCYTVGGFSAELIMEDQIFEHPIIEMIQDQSHIIVRLVDRIGILEAREGRFDLSLARWIITEPEADLTGTRNAWFRPQRMQLQGSELYISFSSSGRIEDHIPPGSGIMSINIDSPSTTTPRTLWRKREPGDAALIKRDASNNMLFILDSASQWIRVCLRNKDGEIQVLSEFSPGDQIVTFDAWDDMLAVLDISSHVSLYNIKNPETPILVTQLYLEGASLVSLWRDKLIVAVSGQSEAGQEDRELFIYSLISGELSPEPKRITVCQSEVRAVSGYGDSLYVACRRAGLIRLLLSDEDIVTIKEVIPTPAEAWDVAVAGRNIFVLTRFPTPRDEVELIPIPIYGGVRIFEDNDNHQLREIGNYETRLLDQGGLHKEWSITIDGNYAVIIAAESVVRILDIEDPSAVREVATIEVPGVATSAVIVEGVVYVTCLDGGIVWMSLVGLGNDAPKRLFMPFLLRRR